MFDTMERSSGYKSVFDSIEQSSAYKSVFDSIEQSLVPTRLLILIHVKRNIPQLYIQPSS